MPTYVDKITLTGPIPWGGTVHVVSSDPIIPRLIWKGYRITRQWTVKVNADGTRESLPLT